jgi:DNA repair protein RadC
LKKILPREKALLSGIRSLSDDEILALILSTGTRRKNVFELSRSLTENFKLSELAEMPIKALAKVEGIGLAKALRLSASFELGRRVYHKDLQPFDRKHLSAIFYNLSQERKENLVLIMYDGAGFHIKTEVIGVGSLNSVMIHPREIFEPIFKNSASQFILAHNHVDGRDEPSKEDIRFTKNIKDIADRLGINFVESFIVVKNKAVGILNGLVMEF